MLCSCRVRQNLYCCTSNTCDILPFDSHAAAAGNVDVNPVEGEKTATGAQKETFGTGSSAQSEAGKKGGAISGESSNVGSRCQLVHLSEFVAVFPRRLRSRPVEDSSGLTLAATASVFQCVTATCADAHTPHIPTCTRNSAFTSALVLQLRGLQRTARLPLKRLQTPVLSDTATR